MTLERTFGMNQNSLKMWVIYNYSSLVFRQNQLLLRSEFGVVAQGWNMYIYIFIYRTDVHFHKPKVSEDAVHA